MKKTKKNTIPLQLILKQFSSFKSQENNMIFCIFFQQTTQI